MFTERHRTSHQTMTGFLTEYDRFQLRKVQVPDNIKVPRIAPRLVEWFAALERQLADEATDADRRLKLNEFFPINRKLDFRQNLLMIKRRSLQVGNPLRALELWEKFYWNGNRDPDDFRLKTINHAVRCLVAGEYDRHLFVHIAKKLLGDKYIVVRIKPLDELFEVFDEVEAVYDAWARIRLGLRYSRVKVLRRHYNRVYTYGKALGVLRSAAREEARDLYRSVLKDDLRMRKEELAARAQVKRQLQQEVPQELAEEEQVMRELAELGEDEDYDEDDVIDDYEVVEIDDEEEIVIEEEEGDEDVVYEFKQEVNVKLKEDIVVEEILDDDDEDIVMNDVDAANEKEINQAIDAALEKPTITGDDDYAEEDFNDDVESDDSLANVSTRPESYIKRPKQQPSLEAKKEKKEKKQPKVKKEFKVKKDKKEKKEPKLKKEKKEKKEPKVKKETKNQLNNLTGQLRIPANLKMDLVGMEDETVDLTSPRRTRRHR